MPCKNSLYVRFSTPTRSLTFLGTEVANLTATGIRALRESGRDGDDNELFLLVGKTGSRSWMVRVQKDGKRRAIGLGSERKVSLARARVDAALVCSQVEAGVDPVTARIQAAGIPTFREAAALVHAEH